LSPTQHATTLQLRSNLVEPQQSRLHPEKSGKNVLLDNIRMGSGWWRVAHGGCGTKAPPLASRPVGNSPGPGTVSWAQSD